MIYFIMHSHYPKLSSLKYHPYPILILFISIPSYLQLQMDWQDLTHLWSEQSILFFTIAELTLASLWYRMEEQPILLLKSRSLKLSGNGGRIDLAISVFFAIISPHLALLPLHQVMLTFAANWGLLLQLQFSIGCSPSLLLQRLLLTSKSLIASNTDQSKYSESRKNSQGSNSQDSSYNQTSAYPDLQTVNFKLIRFWVSPLLSWPTLYETQAKVSNK